MKQNKGKIKEAIEKGQDYYLKHYKTGSRDSFQWECINIKLEDNIDNLNTECVLLCASAPECPFDPLYKDPTCPIRINYDDPLLLSSESKKPWYMQKSKMGRIDPTTIPAYSTKNWYLSAGNQGLTWHEEKNDSSFRDIIILSENNKIEGLGAQIQANDITLKNNTAHQKNRNEDNLLDNQEVQGMIDSMQEQTPNTFLDNTTQQEGKKTDKDDAKNHPNLTKTNKNTNADVNPSLKNQNQGKKSVRDTKSPAIFSSNADYNRRVKIAVFGLGGIVLAIGICYYYVSGPNQKRHDSKIKNQK